MNLLLIILIWRYIYSKLWKYHKVLASLSFENHKTGFGTVRKVLARMVHVNFWAFLFSCVFFLQRIFPQSIAYCACYVKQWMPWTWELRVGGMDFLGIALEKKWGSVLKRFFNLISRGWDFLICLKDKHFSVQKYVKGWEKVPDLKSEGFVTEKLGGIFRGWFPPTIFFQLCCFFKIFWPFRNFLPILNNAGHHGSKYASCLWRMRVEAPGILENQKNLLGNFLKLTQKSCCKVQYW